VDASLLLRRWDKISMGGNTETKNGVETEGKAIQRLSHLGIHSIYRHQSQTLLWMTRSACWHEPNIAVFWKALPEPDKYRGRCSHPTIELSLGSLMEKLEKGLKELREFVAPWREQQCQLSRLSQSYQGLDQQPKNPHSGTQSSGCICGRGWPCWTSVGAVALWPEGFRDPSVG
jgi:hypothetical protein